jgi:MFS family permease
VLTNAIALNSGMFNIATAIGPALGGIAYAFFGPAWCFIINAVSFLAVITALLLMKLPPVMRNTREISPLIEMRDGIQYVMKAPFIQIMILIVTFSTLLGFSLFTLLPAWAVTILHGDARTNGFLQSFRGLGALSAAFFIAFLGNTKFRLRLLKIGIIAFPCFMMIFSIITVRPLSFITVRPLSFFIIFLAGSGLMFIYNLANAFVQSTVKDEFRGRVMSIYALTFFGTLPLGSLAAGALADSIGSALVVFGSSVILLIFAVVVLRFSKGIQLAKENREGAL